MSSKTLKDKNKLLLLKWRAHTPICISMKDQLYLLSRTMNLNEAWLHVTWQWLVQISEQTFKQTEWSSSSSVSSAVFFRTQTAQFLHLPLNLGHMSHLILTVRGLHVTASRLLSSLRTATALTHCGCQYNDSFTTTSRGRGDKKTEKVRKRRDKTDTSETRWRGHFCAK